MKNDSMPLGKILVKIREQLDKLLDKGDLDPRWQALYDEEHRMENIIVERNLNGQKLEKQGDIEAAIRLYEQNVSDEVDTPHPYSRLAVIYRKQNRPDDEIGILEKAMKVLGESDKWEKQLAKAREKQQD